MVKLNKTEIRKKHREWSKLIRQVGRCINCGEKEMKKLDAHHILVKERYPEFRFEEMNGICLCKRCHKFGKISAHRNPIWFTNWLRNKDPGKYFWAYNEVEQWI